MNFSDTLIESLNDMANESAPEAVLMEARKCLLDYLGTALAGAVMLRPKNLSYLDCFHNDLGESTVIGLQRKASMHNAAFINGMNSHTTELDDGHRFCNVHLGATILPSLLAVAEQERLSGTDLQRGVVIGYEAAIRLGRAIQPSHKNRGYHVSGTCGTIGAAIGIAAALGFSKGQLKNTLSAAVTSAAGVMEVLEGDSELKPYNIGRASLDGLTAAYIARAGFRGADDILGSKKGFFAVMSDQHDTSGLAGITGGNYNILKIYRKPYAACRHCHPAIEAAIHIRETHGITCEDVIEISVHTYQLAVLTHDYTKIQGVTSAKLSIPFCVATALVTGKADILAFVPEHICNPEIHALTQKVKVYADDALSALVPHKRTAVVEVLTSNGRCLRERVDYPRGEPENPMSLEEIEAKFISLAIYGGKSREEADRIIEQVWNLESQSLPNLIRLLQ